MSDLTLSLPTQKPVYPAAPAASGRRPFLTPLPEPGHFLLVIDNTGMEKIKRCHMAARNYLILAREPHARNAALSFGGAIHAGLELLLREQFEHAQGFDSETCGDYAQNKAILDYFAANPTPPDEYRTPAAALEVLAHYRKRSDPDLFPDYAWEIQQDERGPVIERAFELPLGVIEVKEKVLLPSKTVNGQDFMDARYVSHIHIAWSGRIDAIAKCGPGQTTRIVDHKTSSIDGDQFIQSFQLSSQTIGYVWAARQLWPSLDVAGFCLNVIRLKKPGKGQGLLDRGVRGGDAPLAFFRAYFDYSDERISDWAEDALTLVEDFIHSLVRNRFPLNDRHCFDKFGRCPYFDVCSYDGPGGAAIREKLLQSESFKPVTWNPVH